MVWEVRSRSEGRQNVVFTPIVGVIPNFWKN
jgi:hypothetical protein